MRTFLTLLLVGCVLAFSAALEATGTNSLTERHACAVLQRRIAKIDGVPVSGPAGIGWFCDFSTLGNEDWYVIALRSKRRCEGICSNLMGWYAVNRRTGSVHTYDMADPHVGPPVKKTRG